MTKEWVRQYCHACKKTQEAEHASKEAHDFLWKHFHHGKFTSIMLGQENSREQAMFHGVPYIPHKEEKEV